MQTSILLPVYNGDKYLESALRSVLEQDADFEILVQDDCSTDKSEEITRSMADPRVKYVKNPKNSGCWASLQAAAERSKGELLRLFSHDDLMLTGDLASAESCLRNNAGFGVVISDYDKIDSNDAITGSSLDYEFPKRGLPDRIQGATAAWFLFQFGCISGTQSTITVRRSLFDAVGGFDPWMRFCGDFAFLAKCVPKGGLIYNHQITTKIRFHPQQTSKDGKRQLVYVDEMREVIGRLLAQMDEPLRKKALSEFKWIYGYQFFHIAMKRLTRGDGRFLRRFYEKFDWKLASGSGMAWGCGVPRRVIRRMAPKENPSTTLAVAAVPSRGKTLL